MPIWSSWQDNITQLWKLTTLYGDGIKKKMNSNHDIDIEMIDHTPICAKKHAHWAKIVQIVGT